jgi:hypothetical protein
MTEANNRPLFKSKKTSTMMKDIKQRIAKYELVKEAILHSNSINIALAYLYIKFFSTTKNY